MADLPVQDSLLLQPRRRFALMGALVLLGVVLLALASSRTQLRREAALGLVTREAYNLSFTILIVMGAVVPVLAFFTVRRINRVWLSPTEIVVGRQRAAWSAISHVSWQGGRGGNTLLLHREKGEPLKVPASMYPGGEERTLLLMKKYLPAELLLHAEAEMRESD